MIATTATAIFLVLAATGVASHRRDDGDEGRLVIDDHNTVVVRHGADRASVYILTGPNNTYDGIWMELKPDATGGTKITTTTAPGAAFPVATPQSLGLKVMSGTACTVRGSSKENLSAPHFSPVTIVFDEADKEEERVVLTWSRVVAPSSAKVKNSCGVKAVVDNGAYKTWNGSLKQASAAVFRSVGAANDVFQHSGPRVPGSKVSVRFTVEEIFVATDEFCREVPSSCLCSPYNADGAAKDIMGDPSNFCMGIFFLGTLDNSNPDSKSNDLSLVSVLPDQTPASLAAALTRQLGRALGADVDDREIDGDDGAAAAAAFSRLSVWQMERFLEAGKLLRLR